MTRKRIFILEDELDVYPRCQIKEVLSEKHDLVTAKSCDEAIEKYPLNGPYDLLCLDHDMEGNYEYREDFPNTGFQFVKWLVEETEGDSVLPQVILHSHNPVGKERMRALLEEHGFDVTVTYFGTAYVKQLKEQLG